MEVHDRGELLVKRLRAGQRVNSAGLVLKA
jgi:hypothetical protein